MEEPRRIGLCAVEDRDLGPLHRDAVRVAGVDARASGADELVHQGRGIEGLLAVSRAHKVQNCVGRREPGPLAAAELRREGRGPVDLVHAIPWVRRYETLDRAHEAGTHADVPRLDGLAAACERGQSVAHIVRARRALALLDQVVVDLGHLAGVRDAVVGVPRAAALPEALAAKARGELRAEPAPGPVRGMGLRGLLLGLDLGQLSLQELLLLPLEALVPGRRLIRGAARVANARLQLAQRASAAAGRAASIILAQDARRDVLRGGQAVPDGRQEYAGAGCAEHASRAADKGV
mmetsp:Transcript_1866/g.5642  ORF Transcript_1866/g.5642 Transcript_1866/m.5642 type:complete len:293 (+) Transcript_1866:1129-2007(+)